MTTEDYHENEARQRQQAAAAIRSASRIAIACHVHPDGDALGSMLGLGLAIEAGFPDKQVTYLAQDGVPYIYRFLPGSERVLTRSEPLDIDLAIVVDSGDIVRVGENIQPLIAAAPLILDIDHHVGEGSFGCVRLLDNRAAATAEIVFELVAELGLPIDKDIATCLFTGVITDTGSFRFMNVTPRTLRVAASLIEFGASPAMIAEQVFDNRPFSATRLMGLALSTLSKSDDGRVVWATVSGEAFEETEGFINPVRAVRGAEVGLLFREVQVGRIRVSLRSTDKIDVSKVAAKFGGGGHRMASGCSYDGTLEEAVNALTTAVIKVLPAK